MNKDFTKNIIDSLSHLTASSFKTMLETNQVSVIQMDITPSNYVGFPALFCSLMCISPEVVTVLSTQDQKDNADVDYHKVENNHTHFHYELNEINQGTGPQYVLLDGEFLVGANNRDRLSNLISSIVDEDMWLDQGIIILNKIGCR